MYPTLSSAQPQSIRERVSLFVKFPLFQLHACVLFFKAPQENRHFLAPFRHIPGPDCRSLVPEAGGRGEGAAAGALRENQNRRAPETGDRLLAVNSRKDFKHEAQEVPRNLPNATSKDLNLRD